MAFTIIWSAFAEKQLDAIYDYHKKKAGARIAKKLITGIISEPEKIVAHPESGQIEPLLIHRKIEYRYLVFKNYKLIYSTDRINGLIKIADVFDSRQNPSKISRTD